MDNTKQLRNTDWLAKRLSLSVTTVERMRVKKPESLPPHITIGKSIRYEEDAVNSWINSQLKPSSMTTASSHVAGKEGDTYA